jgi:hypothetical protein
MRLDGITFGTRYFHHFRIFRCCPIRLSVQENQRKTFVEEVDVEMQVIAIRKSVYKNCALSREACVGRRHSRRCRRHGSAANPEARRPCLRFTRRKDNGRGTPVNYSYNKNGSMTAMPHLQSMEWNFAEQVQIHSPRPVIEHKF